MSTKNEAADSLLGQLQRGRGLGFLRALQEDTVVIRPLLLNCVLHDPRWDQQLESRGDYYANLIMHTTMPLDALDAQLRSSSNTGDLQGLILETLCALAERGYTPVFDILRVYLSYGEDWQSVFETLVGVPDSTLHIEEMSRIIDQRFPEDETLDDELTFVAPVIPDTQEEVWHTLRQINIRVDDSLKRHEKRLKQQAQDEEAIKAKIAHLSTAELLATPLDDTSYRFIRNYIQKRVTTGDLDRLLRVVQYGEYRQRVIALRGLQSIAQPSVLPILRAFFESPDTQPGPLYGAAVGAITALPASLTLDLARSWFDAPDGLHRHVALHILVAHATRADVQRVRRALLPSLQRDTRNTNEYYMQCDIMGILARFPEAGPYPEIETVFKEAEYARARGYAARALAASDPAGFARGLAYECLWDCEERVRLIACQHVDLTLPNARMRVEALAQDLYEEQSVRDAASRRIRGFS